MIHANTSRFTFLIFLAFEYFSIEIIRSVKKKARTSSMKIKKTLVIANDPLTEENS